VFATGVSPYTLVWGARWSQVRDLWEEYYTGADAIVFMVDSSDHERFDEVRVWACERWPSHSWAPH